MNLLALSLCVLCNLSKYDEIVRQKLIHWHSKYQSVDQLAPFCMYDSIWLSKYGIWYSKIFDKHSNDTFILNGTVTANKLIYWHSSVDTIANFSRQM